MAVEQHSHNEGCGCLGTFLWAIVLVTLAELHYMHVPDLIRQNSILWESGQALTTRVVGLEARLSILEARKPVEVEKK